MTVWVVTRYTYWPDDGGLSIVGIYGTEAAALAGLEKAKEERKNKPTQYGDSFDVESYPVIVEEES